MIKKLIDYLIIRTSGKFDKAYYYKLNPDVQIAKVDPIWHYMTFGWKEGRNPSALFLTRPYLDCNPDAKSAKTNPLSYHIKYGFSSAFLNDFLKNEKIRIKIPFLTKLLYEKQIERKIKIFLARFNIELESRDVILKVKELTPVHYFIGFIRDLNKLGSFMKQEQKPTEPGRIINTRNLHGSLGEDKHRRILFITSNFPRTDHGGGNRIHHFIKYLSENNDVFLCTRYEPEYDISELEKVTPYCKKILTISSKDFPHSQEEIKKWINGVDIDIVHYEFPESVINFSKDYGRYSIFTNMEVTSLRLLIDLEKTPALSKTWCEKLCEMIKALRIELVDTEKVDEIITVTKNDADFLRRFDARRTYAVVNTGVAFDDPPLPVIKSEPNSLVFVGNYQHYPNVDGVEFFFNEVWDLIKEEIPEVRTYLVGPRLNDRVTRFVDGKQIIATGGVPDIRPYILRAAVGIAPLVTGAGIRGKVIDYAASRRTFVATSIAVKDLLFQDGVDFFLADTAQEFAQRIITLLRDNELRHKMSTSAYNNARKHYDSRYLTECLVRFYTYIENK